MYIEKLFLQNFRNYISQLFTFEKGVNVLVGKNAVGKTNALETCFLLATGESIRAQKIDEMVSWGKEVAHVGGKILRQSSSSHLSSTNGNSEFDLKSAPNISNENEVVELQVVLTRGVVGGEKARKRQFLVNGVSRQKQNFVGNFTAVSFLPTDLQLIAGSPSKRRTYLDLLLCQVDREYQRSLLSYEKALKRRNKVLDLIREGTMQRSALHFWDQLLIHEGTIITNNRQTFINFVNDRSKDHRVVYNFSLISEQRLLQYSQEEVIVGYTMVGPHKDDFIVESRITNHESKFKNLALYGSRGEQRMGVLWLKMSEMDYIEHRLGERPVLLLDDIFSELDAEHEAVVWKLSSKQQTIITTSDEIKFSESGINLIRVE